MPKVMYRPNPVPPPFTPPTPSGIIMFANPANFDQDTGLQTKFNVRPNIDFHHCTIYVDGIEIGTVTSNRYSTTDFYFLNVETHGSLPFEGNIKFFSEEEELLSLPLSAIYSES